ncbi:MAG: gamma-glutamyl-gamma-aminobutyrate hydrolase family protein [Candidatus Brocadiae bacterium]|nr:gamma-glutamyl-gamma-aminobutyrate hydrolase family protein [Candidatus Brocadiia bacterium]
MKPLIALNMNQEAQVYSLRHSYRDAVVAAGGIPVFLPPLADLDDVDAVLEGVDGVVLTGGGDIDPARFGQKPHGSLTTVLQPKHDSDFRLAARALEFRLPTLGICYGMQLLTVLRGGDLIQDIPSMIPGACDHYGSPEKDSEHPVTLEEGSLIHRIVGKTRLSINSHHHQGAGKTGSLKVTARSEDGVVEAVEPREQGDGWVLGVQWHPERMPGRVDMIAIYGALVAAAARYREGSGFDVTILK